MSKYTANGYDGGDLLRSFIGMIDISNGKTSEICLNCQIPDPEENLKEESATIEEEISSGKTKLILITYDEREIQLYS